DTRCAPLRGGKRPNLPIRPWGGRNRQVRKLAATTPRSREQVGQGGIFTAADQDRDQRLLRRALHEQVGETVDLLVAAGLLQRLVAVQVAVEHRRHQVPL